MKMKQKAKGTPAKIKWIGYNKQDRFFKVI